MKKTIFSISLLVITLCLMTSVVFAWFIGGKTQENNIQFETGKIAVMVDIFQIQDFNNDGITDTNDDNSTKLSKSIKDRGINLTNCVPGEIFTYRLKITNTGIPVFLQLKANTSGYSKATLNNIMSINYMLNSVSNKTMLFGASVDAIPLEENIRIGQGATINFDFQLQIEHLDYLKTNPITSTEFANDTNLNAYKSKTFNNTTLIFEFIQGK